MEVVGWPKYCFWCIDVVELLSRAGLVVGGWSLGTGRWGCFLGYAEEGRHLRCAFYLSDVDLSAGDSSTLSWNGLRIAVHGQRRRTNSCVTRSTRCGRVLPWMHLWDLPHVAAEEACLKRQNCHVCNNSGKNKIARYVKVISLVHDFVLA